jgi:hypothetical protein
MIQKTQPNERTNLFFGPNSRTDPFPDQIWDQFASCVDTSDTVGHALCPPSTWCCPTCQQLPSHTDTDRSGGTHHWHRPACCRPSSSSRGWPPLSCSGERAPSTWLTRKGRRSMMRGLRGAAAVALGEQGEPLGVCMCGCRSRPTAASQGNSLFSNSGRQRRAWSSVGGAPRSSSV